MFQQSSSRELHYNMRRKKRTYGNCANNSISQAMASETTFTTNFCEYGHKRNSLGKLVYFRIIVHFQHLIIFSIITFYIGEYLNSAHDKN
jgi:hypothetical protein